MLDTFTRLNNSVEKTGMFSAMEKKSLFRLVAQNNTMFTDVISKIGLLERSDTAWKFAAHSAVWEGLRDEFDLEVGESDPRDTGAAARVARTAGRDTLAMLLLSLPRARARALSPSHAPADPLRLEPPPPPPNPRRAHPAFVWRWRALLLRRPLPHVEDRFKNLEFKLNLVQHNTKFFLEVMHNQKSDTLEWIIIVLISAEICIGLCDLFDLKPV